MPIDAIKAKTLTIASWDGPTRLLTLRVCGVIVVETSDDSHKPTSADDYA
jgi:hypothetical protein